MRSKLALPSQVTLETFAGGRVAPAANYRGRVAPAGKYRCTSVEYHCSSHEGIICFKFWRGAPAGVYRGTSSIFRCLSHGGFVSNSDLSAGLVVGRTSLIHRKRSPFLRACITSANKTKARFNNLTVVRVLGGIQKREGRGSSPLFY